jgi:hypothetical protein
LSRFYNHAQSFFVDDSAVQRATQVLVSSIDVYCKARPAPYDNISGVPNPGMSIYLVPMVNGVPSMAPVDAQHTARCEYAQINPSIDASLATHFIFRTPVPLQTGQVYAFVLVADGNEEFDFWTARAGELNLATGQTISSLGFNGNYFQLTSDATTWSPLAGYEMKFGVNVARYAANGTPTVGNNNILKYKIGNYEFVDYDGLASADKLAGGDKVYMTKGSFDGNVSVIQGNNHAFTNVALTTFYSNADVMMMVIDGGSVVNVRQVMAFHGSEAILDRPVDFTNAQAKFYASVPTATVYMRISSENEPNKRSVILSQSTANSTIAFTNGCSIRSEMANAQLVNCIFQNIVVADVNPQAAIQAPAGTSYLTTETLNFTTSDSGVTFSSLVDTFPAPMYTDTIIPGAPTVLLSRSNEVTLGNTMTMQPSNCSILTINLASSGDFIQPGLTSWATIPVYFTRYYINNDYTHENTSYGNAISKEISAQITLASGQFAEDVVAYINGYRPIGTDFKVFTKFYNSEDPDAFEDKDWTLLQINSGSDKYSSLTNKNDFIEYGYILPSCPNTDFTYSGFMTLNSGQTNVTSTTTSFAANVAIGDLVKIYSPLFPNTNFMVAGVTAVVNSSVITIDQSTTNNSIWGSGLLLDHLGYPRQAFKNNQNGNILRYYDTNFAFHDTYNSFALKIVFLSQTLTTLPYLSSVRCVAVSA